MGITYRNVLMTLCALTLCGSGGVNGAIIFDHAIYLGDIDGDGDEDIYFHSDPDFVLIGGGIALFAPSIKSFVLHYDTPTGTYGPTTQFALPDHQLVPLGLTLGTAGSDYVVGDTNSDGIDDIEVFSVYGAVVVDGTDTVVKPSPPAPVPVEGDPADDVMTEPVDNGQLSGWQSVGNDGAFHYRVPIEVPPGINGMEPTLSLNYHSNRKNGLLGWGWSLGGLSVISRCAASLARDNKISSVLHGDHYRYCLDGQRLVEVASGEYRTENESFAKIVSAGSAGDGPATWTVYGKDGRVYHYGHTPTARQREHNLPDVFAWHLNRVSDVAGNYLDIVYENDGTPGVVAGVHRPEKIEYTKHDAAASTHQAVIFHYETRSDTTEKYTGGVLRVNDKRLNIVELKSNGSTVRYYNLDYQASGQTYFGKVFADPTHTSRLAKITLCTSSSVCAEPIEFDWTQATSEDFALDTSATIAPSINEVETALRGDFNGDGIQDIVYIDGNQYRFRAHDSAPSSADAVWYNCDAGGDDCSHWNFNTAGPLPAQRFSIRYRVHDMNGDGKDDLISAKENFADFYVALSTGTSFSQPVLWGTPAGTNEYTARSIIDINGDTLPDAVSIRGEIYVAGSNVAVRLNTGTGFGPEVEWYNGGNQPLPSNFADFNGDGLVDLWSCLFSVDAEVCHLLVMINRGDFLEAPVAWLLSTTMQGKRFGDVNGDGLLDLIEFREDQPVVSDTAVSAYVRLSTGSGWLAEQNWTVSSKVLGRYNHIFGGLTYNGTYTHELTTVLSDINGDGCADLISTGAAQAGPLPGAQGIYVSLSRCAYNSALGMGFTPVMQWYDQPAPGLYFQAPPGLTYSNFLQQPGYAGAERLLNLDGKGLPDMRFGTAKLSAHRITAVIAGYQGRQSTAITYAAITDTTVHQQIASTTPGIDSIVAPGEQRPPIEVVDGQRLAVSNATRPVHVVKDLHVANGIGGTQLTTYFYTGYQFHQLGLGGLGFASLQKTEQVNGSAEIRSTTSEFSQAVGVNYSLAGALLKKSVYATDKNRSGGSVVQLLSETNYRWKIRTYSDDIDAGFTSPHYFPYLYQLSTSRWDLNGDPIADTVVNYFNDNGAPSCAPLPQPVIQTTAAGSVGDTDYHADGVAQYIESLTCDTSDSAASKRVTVVNQGDIISLANTATTPWVRGLIGRVDRQAWVGAELADLTLATRSTEMHYNAKGQLLSVTVEPDAPVNSPLTHTSAYSYNVYGSVASVTETFGTFANDGVDFTSRVTSIDETFDSSGVRTVTVTNPKGHVETTDYHVALGLPSRTTDANGLVTEVVYDSWGREDRHTRPDGTAVKTYYRQCETSCFSHNPHVAAYTQVKATGVTAVRIYTDTLGREVGTRTRSFDGTPIYTVQTYDAQGNVANAIDPFFVADPQYTTHFEYDILKRLTKTTFADGATHTNLYTGLTQTNTWAFTGATYAGTDTAVSQSQTRLLNALGWVMQSTDNAGTPVAFTYGPFGELKRTQVNGDASTQVTMAYDLLGRKTQLNDPNIGVIDYTYNPLGLVATETDAKGQATHYTYDMLGRQIKRIDDATAANPEQRTHTWTYDNKAHGVGLLGTLSGFNTDATAFIEQHTYTALSLPHTRTTNTYVVTQEYDAFSRPLKTIYPSGYALTRVYNNYGYLSALKNSANDALWIGNSSDARGNITQFTLGNGVVTDQTYDGPRGRIASIHAHRGNLTLQQHHYTFDSVGNLTERQDVKHALVQQFCYDALNRLRAARFSGCDQSSADFTYDALGNITGKLDISGTISYGAGTAGPHALTSAHGLTYQYDPNGSLVKALDGTTILQTVTYSPFNKPTRMEKGTQWSAVVYGPHKARVKRTDSDGRTTTYLGNLYEETTDNGVTQKVHYLDGVALYVESSGAVTGAYYRYLHRDHMGSVVAQSGESADSAADVQWLSNGPWGERRQDIWDGIGEGVDYVPSVTARGFSDHEHLDPVGLIHMNGRVYDPNLGRFLSPDPYIQAPHSSQSYNRYSYVANNPLSFTDPTGYLCSGGDEGCYEEVTTLGEIYNAGQDWASFGVVHINYANLDTAINDTVGVIDPGVWLNQIADVEAYSSEFNNVDNRTAFRNQFASYYAGAEISSYYELIGFVQYTRVTMRALTTALSALTDSTLAPARKLIGEAAQSTGSGAKVATKGANKLCFVEGTPVHTEDGLKSIEDIQVGDLVASKDELTGETTWKPVVGLFRNENKSVLNLSLVDDDGAEETLGVTPEHPFWVDGKGWIDAGELQVGDMIVALEGKTLSVNSIVPDSELHTTYNFEVADYHTYFVGQDGAWVHNQCRGLWQITKEGTEKVVQHGKFGKVFKSKSDGLWWSKDIAGHGGSQWKVFRETKKGLEWMADVDKHGDFIVGKHKGDVGKFIPWKELKGSKF